VSSANGPRSLKLDTLCKYFRHLHPKNILTQPYSTLYTGTVLVRLHVFTQSKFKARIVSIANSVSFSNVGLKFQWIPSYCGLLGIELVDTLAKSEADLPRWSSLSTYSYNIKSQKHLLYPMEPKHEWQFPALPDSLDFTGEARSSPLCPLWTFKTSLPRSQTLFIIL